jgi:hypothetical protein
VENHAESGKGILLAMHNTVTVDDRRDSDKCDCSNFGSKRFRARKIELAKSLALITHKVFHNFVKNWD